MQSLTDSLFKTEREMNSMYMVREKRNFPYNIEYTNYTNYRCELERQCSAHMDEDLTPKQNFNGPLHMYDGERTMMMI